MKKVRRRTKFYNENLGTVKQMNDEVYALRRKVIDIIYDIKRTFDIPRIDVRITDTEDRHLGMAWLGDNTVFIPTKTVTGRFKAYLYEVVAHEVVHAVTGFRHDEKCDLMRARVGAKPLTESKVRTLLKKYLTKKGH